MSDEPRARKERSLGVREYDTTLRTVSLFLPGSASLLLALVLSVPMVCFRTQSPTGRQARRQLLIPSARYATNKYLTWACGQSRLGAGDGGAISTPSSQHCPSIYFLFERNSFRFFYPSLSRGTDCDLVRESTTLGGPCRSYNVDQSRNTKKQLY